MEESRSSRSFQHPFPSIVTFLACGAILGYFVFFLGDALRVWFVYRETTCKILRQDLIVEEHVTHLKRGVHVTMTYQPWFEVEYPVDRGKRTAFGYDYAGQPFYEQSRAQHTVRLFPVGSFHPCWFDPKDLDFMVLDRSLPVYYILGPLVLVMGMAISLLVLTRRRNPDLTLHFVVAVLMGTLIGVPGVLIWRDHENGEPLPLLFSGVLLLFFVPFLFCFHSLLCGLFLPDSRPSRTPKEP